MTFRKIKASNKSLGKRRLICGVGLNDADYIVQPVVDGKRLCCPFYLTWKSMVSRCYSEKIQKSRPSYTGCSVCEEWLVFSNFKSWMIKRNWKGKELDKDLVVKGNKIYSADTCVFISSLVNSLLHENKNTRGAFKLGVSLHKSGRFQASVGRLGKQVYLGLFDTESEAYSKYIIEKVKVIDFVISAQSDDIVIKALEEHKNYLISPIDMLPSSLPGLVDLQNHKKETNESFEKIQSGIDNYRKKQDLIN